MLVSEVVLSIFSLAARRRAGIWDLRLSSRRFNRDSSSRVLITHTGVSFTAGERDAWVSGLGTSQLTRAEVLRSIAENQSFVSKKMNEAFVMMEYFGYLRRDSDDSGYHFWLNKLNEFGGNFEQAEMVKAFIVSGEYRDRFPQ
jgi:hypothetical protein